MSEQRGCPRILLGASGVAWPALVVDHRGVRLERDESGVWTWIAATENRTLDVRWFFWRLSEHEIALLNDPDVVILADGILRCAIDGLFADNELAEYRRRLRRAA